MSMLVSILAVVVGFALLIWGADRFVAGAAGLARNLGVSPLLIGLTIVGIGTSAPEILVSTMASIQGSPGIAIGNAIGSNIANIGLIIGITALLVPLTVHSDILRKEFPLLMLVSVTAYLLMMDQELDQFDGMILLVGLLVALALVVQIARGRRAGDALALELREEYGDADSTGKCTALFAIGLMVLLVSSRLLVWGAENIAHYFGVSDLVIGLTIVAIGTSLPELAASIASARKGEPDIAVGNVLGSNLYNILAVLCVPGLVAPGRVDETVITRDLPVMLGLTVALFLMSTAWNGHGRINRAEALTLLICFTGYQFWVYQTSMAG